MKNKIDIAQLAHIAFDAGQAILDIYHQSATIEVVNKSDNSPLTAADKAANALIVERLKELYPHIPQITEETAQAEYSTRKDWTYCFLIDPLDGTKEFIKRNGEFTVNIALVHNNTAVAGVVYLPVKGECYLAAPDFGAEKWYYDTDASNAVPIKKEKIAAQAIQADKEVVIVASRSHLNEATAQFIANQEAAYPNVSTRPAGSALKMCLVADGQAHLYPRFAPTMEWDTAAGTAIALAAGATVVQMPEKVPMQYNKAKLTNPHFLVAAPGFKL